MSMQEYPVVEEGSFLIDGSVAPWIWRNLDRQDGTVPEELQGIDDETFTSMIKNNELPEEYYRGDGDLFDILNKKNIPGLIWCSDFSGEISSLRGDALEFTLDGEEILYIQSERASTLFQAAYSSFEELLEEFKHKLTGLGISDDFDWEGHVVKINGTNFC